MVFNAPTGGESHGVLLGDADIVVTIRELLGKAHHPRAFAHRRRDADEARIGGGHVAQPVAEDLRIGRLRCCGRRLNADVRLELADAVIEDGVGLGLLVALALLGDHVQELRPLQVTQVLQRRDQRVEIVAVGFGQPFGARHISAQIIHHGGVVIGNAVQVVVIGEAPHSVLCRVVLVFLFFNQLC